MYRTKPFSRSALKLLLLIILLQVSVWGLTPYFEGIEMRKPHFHPPPPHSGMSMIIFEQDTMWSFSTNWKQAGDLCLEIRSLHFHMLATEGVLMMLPQEDDSFHGDILSTRDSLIQKRDTLWDTYSLLYKRVEELLVSHPHKESIHIKIYTRYSSGEQRVLLFIVGEHSYVHKGKTWSEI